MDTRPTKRSHFPGSRLAVASVIFHLAVQGAFAAIDPSSLQKGSYNSLSYTFGTGETIGFNLYVPSSYSTSANLPLIVNTHGGGARSNYCNNAVGENSCLLPYLGLGGTWSEAENPCVILEPNCSPSWCGTPTGNCWDGICAPAGSHVHNLSNPPAGLRIVRDLVPIVMDDLGLDYSRVYATGWSNGGSAAWDFIMYWPDFFAAAIVIAGAGDTAHAYRHVDVPVWVTHAPNDDVVPYRAATEMVDKLESLGGSPRYTWIAGWSHGTLFPTYQSIPEIVPWLFSQQKGVSTARRWAPSACRRAKRSLSAQAPVLIMSSQGLRIVCRPSGAAAAVYDLHGRMVER
jgi:predicted peptidase